MCKSNLHYLLFEEDYIQSEKIAPSFYLINLFFNDKQKLNKKFPNNLVKISKLKSCVDWKVIKISQNVWSEIGIHYLKFQTLAFAYYEGYLSRIFELKSMEEKSPSQLKIGIQKNEKMKNRIIKLFMNEPIMKWCSEEIIDTLGVGNKQKKSYLFITMNSSHTMVCVYFVIPNFKMFGKGKVKNLAEVYRVKRYESSQYEKENKGCYGVIFETAFFQTKTKVCLVPTKINPLSHSLVTLNLERELEFIKK